MNHICGANPATPDAPRFIVAVLDAINGTISIATTRHSIVIDCTNAGTLRKA
jgi:hypothetical protein